jgi:GTP-binding protein HflX
VETVLAEIGVVGKPSVLVLNKSDLIDDHELAGLRGRYPDAVVCSATQGEGLDALRARISDELARLEVEIALDIPFERGDLVARVHDEGEVLHESYTVDGTHLVARIARDALEELSPYRSTRS